MHIKIKHIVHLAPFPYIAIPQCLPVAAARTDIGCLVRGYCHQLHTATHIKLKETLEAQIVEGNFGSTNF